MKREARYLVVKKTDMAPALTIMEMLTLHSLCEKIAKNRKAQGKPRLECVVVESDWPEYEPTWRAIERRVDGSGGSALGLEPHPDAQHFAKELVARSTSAPKHGDAKDAERYRFWRDCWGRESFLTTLSKTITSFSTPLKKSDYNNFDIVSDAAILASAKADGPAAVAGSVAPAPVAVKMWHQRAQEAQPKSDPEFWPLSFKAGFMEDEIIDLRAALSGAGGSAPGPEPHPDALPREEFAALVVHAACETEPADPEDIDCIKILTRDLHCAVLAAFMRSDISSHAKAEPTTTDMVQAAAQRLTELANLAGLVVTIERRPLQPLAMGHAEYVIQTRPVRTPS